MKRTVLHFAALCGTALLLTGSANAQTRQPNQAALRNAETSKVSDASKPADDVKTSDKTPDAGAPAAEVEGLKRRVEELENKNRTLAQALAEINAKLNTLTPASASNNAATTNAAAATPRERRFAFEYKTTVKDIPAGTKKVELWIPVPHDSPLQTIKGLTIESPFPYKMHSMKYGNRALHLTVENPTQTSFTVTMRFDAARWEHIKERLSDASFAPANEARDPDMSRWLKADRLVPIDDKIKQWSQEVVDAAGAKTDLEKARAIYNHVVSTVKYDKTGQGWGRGDIYYACDARRGNCTDFHAIFIGYARAQGIPARFSIGFPLPASRGEGQIAGYHCWAEFYIKGVGWVPVDASEAAKDPARREYFFGAHDENRVEFTRGRDLTLSPKQKGDPLNYFVYPYAEVDGKPFASVDRVVSYKDQPADAPAAAGR